LFYNEKDRVMKFAFAVCLALTVIFSITGAAHSQQLKALPVNSYVLTDPDGTPRYLVQYSEESKFRRVYYVKPAKTGEPNLPQPAESYRRPAPKKRFVWPNEWM
jgi:hypothetical protein